ncbi:hypothetical protein [Sporolactobacillus putidus]|uniref:Uncharacterized protein n=1 Tax=Sporolactobacillus putidus TaxID=492735 RepID=A0A917W3M1_9BACL|nr:hypothetical protein [Sporolactobacillus putidus]GGL63851.1 hypothetical protein GCM10007968_29810 [Sporolactobacillus putidus]
MDNYDAIKRMSREQMEAFLDNVYLTGLNTGTYAASLEEDSKEQQTALDDNPYGGGWLAAEAEDATRLVFSEDGDAYLPNALCKAIFRTAGIDPEQ